MNLIGIHATIAFPGPGKKDALSAHVSKLTHVEDNMCHSVAIVYQDREIATIAEIFTFDSVYQLAKEDPGYELANTTKA